MKPHVIDRIRANMTQKVLDIADGWSQYKSFLQHLRENQRENAERGHKHSRPPEGTKLEYLYFQMTEVFHFEDFGEMKKGLLSLFPDSKGFPDFGLLATQIDDYGQTISRIGWTRLGVIARDRSKWVGMTINRLMPELPQEVWYIDASLHMVTPSITVLIFHVHLDQKATEQLTRLQEKSYLPKVRLKSLIPLRKQDYGALSTMSETEMRQAIVDWLDELRGKVEKCLRVYVNGYFMHHKSGTSCLPAVEVYSIRGSGLNNKNLGEWKKEAQGWAASFAFDLSFDTFQNEQYVFNLLMDLHGSTIKSPRNRRVGRLLVMAEKLLQSTSLQMYAGNEDFALRHQSNEVLEELMPFLVSVNLLDSIESDFCGIRPAIFGIIGRKVRLGYSIEVRSRIQHSLMLLNRLEMESENTKKYYRKRMAITDTMMETRNTRDKSLASFLQESVEWKIGYIKPQLEYADKWLSSYVETRNMVAMYRVQYGTLWLTLVGSLVAVLEVIFNWPTVVTIAARVAQFAIYLWNVMRAFLKF